MSVKKLVIGLLLFTFFACQSNSPSDITLTLEVDNPDPEMEYSVRTSSSIMADPTVKFKLSEETNSHTVVIPLVEPKMFTISGDFYKIVYAEPGDDLTIKVSTNEEDEKEFEYLGTAAIYAQLIQDLQKIGDDFAEAHAELNTDNIHCHGENMLSHRRYQY